MRNLRHKLQIGGSILLGKNPCTTCNNGTPCTISKNSTRLSNLGVRYIHAVRRETSITPLRRHLGWLRTDSRRWYFVIIILYTVVRMTSYLKELFNVYQQCHPERGELKELSIHHMMGSEAGRLSFKNGALALGMVRKSGGILFLHSPRSRENRAMTVKFQ